MNVNDLVLVSPNKRTGDRSYTEGVVRVADQTSFHVLIITKYGDAILLNRQEHDFEPATAKIIEALWSKLPK